MFMTGIWICMIKAPVSVSRHWIRQGPRRGPGWLACSVAVSRQTAVSAHLKSDQIPLFAFAGYCCVQI